MLRKGERVAVRILEPRHLVARRRGPDAGVVLAGEAVALEHHAALAQRRYVTLDVVDLPAEDGEGPRLVIAHLRHAEHDAVGVEDEREVALAEEAEPQDADEERP